MHEKELKVLVPRSFEMYVFMAEHIKQLQQLDPIPELNCRLAFQFGLLSFEHGLSSLKLIADGFESSGFALMRPQYESLVRGFWLMYADTKTWMAKLSAAGKVGPSELKKLETPLIGDMLKSLQNSPAPDHILSQLNSFRDINNSAYNSFTHSGLMSLITNSQGFDPKLMYDAVRNCNAVAAINLQMLAILTGSKKAMEPVRELHRKYIDCLPIATI